MGLAIFGVILVVVGIVGMVLMLKGTPPYNLMELARSKRHASKNGSRGRAKLS